MIKKWTIVIFITVISCVEVISQSLELSALTIPVELKHNANAVVRNNTVDITIADVNKMTVYSKEVVTVLNKVGNSDARIVASYDKGRKITKLIAIIYDAFGNQIKKFKGRDFTDVSAVDGVSLYTDNRVKYIDYKPISYPYTLVFESEYKTSTTGFIPSWFPINGYFVSVQKSRFRINNPNKIPWRKKETNFKGFNIKKEESDILLNYKIDNQKAFDFEESSISSSEFLPKVIFALDQFNLKGVYGEATNWKEFGKWMYTKLIAGRDVIDESTKNKILDLVKDAKTPIEKAKIVYEYMQNKTRYISVQVGIGGWEPIAANKVDEVGYGDCKGLTNYIKALLDLVGVKSYYTIVYAQEKRNIDDSFASIQGNHAILNIPNEGKDIWLECTSQTTPFGFLGDFTDDRDVLVVTPEGGIIKRTTSYKDEVNLQKINADITLSENGDVKANLIRVSEGIEYDKTYYIENYTKEELDKNYKSRVWGYNNNLEVLSTDIHNDRDNVVFTENLELSIRNYASITDDEFLFRVNIFNRNSYVPKRYRTRNLPLKIKRGYKEEDQYTITIPKTYKIDYVPETRTVDSKFGTYKISFEKLDESTLVYKKMMVIKEGVYPKEDYKSYRSFRRKIAKSENLRIALTKK